MDDSILAKFPDDANVLGPFLGNLPAEILDAVVRKLGWFETTFALAGKSCREAVERVASTRAVLTEEERWPFRSREMTHLAVAVMEADVEALEWLIQRFDGKGLKWRDDGGMALSQLAARRGKIESLRCLYANRCPLGFAVCWFAAREGHLEVLQWARQNGCQWDEDACRVARGGRPPGGAPVGASERVRVGRDDVPGGGFARPPGGVEVCASERVRVGRVDVLWTRRREAI